MTTEEIDDLQIVATIHEQTDSDAERAKVLCQLAESLDDQELLQGQADLQMAVDYPSLGTQEGMDRGQAKLALARMKAVREFKDAVEAVE